MAEKESYSEEELNEMIVWFNNHANELPKEMQINKAAFTPNLKLTIESCIMQAKQKKKEDEQDAGTMVYHRQLDVSIWIDLCRNPQFAWFL